MGFNLEATVWYLILLDCIGANIVAWFFTNWYLEKFETLNRYFPLTKSWCLIYLVFVLWAGCLLYRLKVLPW